MNEDFDAPESFGGRGRWTVDRRIPVALIAAVLISMVTWSGGLIWWVGRLDSSVANQNTRISQLEAYRNSDNDALNKITNLVSRIDERTALFAETIKRAGERK